MGKHVQDNTLAGTVKVSKLDVDAAGFTTQGKGRSQDDYEVEDKNRGFVVKDQNGDRWRLGVQVDGNGVPSMNFIPLDGQ